MASNKTGLEMEFIMDGIKNLQTMFWSNNRNPYLQVVYNAVDTGGAKRL